MQLERMNGGNSKATDLDALRAYFRSRGLGVVDRPYFAPTTLVVYVVPQDQPGEIWTADQMVFVYPRLGGWEARVTRHGGPHWIRQASTIEEIQEIALAVLAQDPFRPDSAWAET
jgi:hypothetical protein